MMYPCLTTAETYYQYLGRKVRVFISGDNDYCWAVEDYKTQQRLFNTGYITLQDISTDVDEAKRKQCVKHVRLTHAWVVGTISEIDKSLSYGRIDYNPHERDCFFWSDSEEKFTSADQAYGFDRQMFATR